MVLAELIGPDLIIVVVLAVVLLFGVNKLPKMARNLGEANKEFKKAQREAQDEAKAEEAKAAPAEDKITMSKADLDALISEREAKARRESEKPSAN